MPDLPHHLAYGWNPTLHTAADRDLIASLPPLHALVAEQPAPYVLPWDIAKHYRNGSHLPSVIQLSSDCVAAGCATVLEYLDLIELAPDSTGWVPRMAHIAWIYGKARVEIGGGNLHGPGATGLWGARVLTEKGHALVTDPGIDTYTKKLSDRWGEPPGPTRHWDSTAIQRCVKRLERCQTVDHVRSALLSGRMLTIASSRGFRMEPLNNEGYNVFACQGSWSHQMSLIAWMDKPFPAAYRLNSWGPQYHGPQLHGEPPGGAWNLSGDLEEELSWPDTECYAYSVLEA